MYRRVFKRWLDFGLSSIVIILLIPLFLIAYLLVKIDSQGPFFFVQERIGKSGKLFKVYKIRTMINKKRLVQRQIFSDNAEITRVGAIFRRLKIDELPQLLNIWKGDMSFVGPRPSLPELLVELNDDGKKRISVRPGLTGLAQVNGNIYLSWEERWKFDREYVERVSFMEDLKILFKTFGIVLFGEKLFLKKS